MLGARQSSAARGRPRAGCHVIAVDRDPGAPGSGSPTAGAILEPDDEVALERLGGQRIASDGVVGARRDDRGCCASGGALPAPAPDLARDRRRS